MKLCSISEMLAVNRLGFALREASRRPGAVSLTLRGLACELAMKKNSEALKVLMNSLCEIGARGCTKSRFLLDLMCDDSCTQSVSMVN